jgi:hypothetical protein
VAKWAAAVAKVKQDGRLLAEVSEELKADREVVLAALQQNARADWILLHWSWKLTERLCWQPGSRGAAIDMYWRAVLQRNFELIETLSRCFGTQWGKHEGVLSEWVHSAISVRMRCPTQMGKGVQKGRGVEAGHFGRDGKISLCMKGEDTHTHREKAVLG